MSRLLLVLGRNWFLFLLALLLSGGMACGLWIPEPDLRAVTRWIVPSYTTALILFLMSFTLDGRRLWHAAALHPAPAVWGMGVNFIAGPLAVWALSTLQPLEDFRIGLLIAGCVPCTLATAAVWTRRAGGNDAVALVVTLSTNAACFLVTPAWLEAMTGRGVELDAAAMGWRLFQCAVLPTAAGQAARWTPNGAAVAARFAKPLAVCAQLLVLLVIFAAATDAGARIASNGRWPAGSSLLVVWLSCVIAHGTLLAIAFLGTRWFHFSREDSIAAMFSGSQKTLPVGLLLATDPRLFAHPDLLGPGLAAPFVLFPMILFHVSQLVADTLVIGWWRRSAPKSAAPTVMN